VSLAKVRKHWRLFATMLLVFLLVAAAGPVIFYGFGPLFSMMVEGPAIVSLTLLLVIAGAAPAWFFFALWAGNKIDHLPLDQGSGEDGGDANG
jgi:uncharacterized RDD family membrane protein YckC